MSHRKKQQERERKPGNVKEAIAKQIEFYLSDANLRRDKFFQDKLKQDAFINVDVFLNCNKVKLLTKNPTVVIEAVEEYSQSKLLINEDKTAIARADHESFDVDKLVASVPPGSLFICNLPINSDLAMLQKDLLHGAYIQFKEPSIRRFVLPVAFADFGSEEALKEFTAKDDVAELPFPGGDSGYDKSKIYALPQGKWDEYISKGEEEFGFSSKAVLHFSMKQNMQKKYPDFKPQILEMIKDITTPKKTLQIGRHVYVEVESQEIAEDIFQKYHVKKTLKLTTLAKYGGVFLFKLDAILAVLLYQHLKVFGEPEFIPEEPDLGFTREKRDNRDNQKGKKRKADDGGAGGNDKRGKFQKKGRDHNNKNKKFDDDDDDAKDGNEESTSSIAPSSPQKEAVTTGSSGVTESPKKGDAQGSPKKGDSSSSKRKQDEAPSGGSPKKKAKTEE
eukprot:TRINITY_DN1134_c0_g1_i1.p1 TRINITY_DN1134_c0_g1~~TRINITY_DN1134_c0_g1_i1.p1  ORF type:complete len:465 (+),score=174.52 TRINITY_DN1134_c0_g1_i1:55-1395(+)